MSDFLTTLAERALGIARPLQPLHPSLYAPVEPLGVVNDPLAEGQREARRQPGSPRPSRLGPESYEYPLPLAAEGQGEGPLARPSPNLSRERDWSALMPPAAETPRPRQSGAPPASSLRPAEPEASIVQPEREPETAAAPPAAAPAGLPTALPSELDARDAAQTSHPFAPSAKAGDGAPRQRGTSAFVPAAASGSAVPPAVVPASRERREPAPASAPASAPLYETSNLAPLSTAGREPDESAPLIPSRLVRANQVQPARPQDKRTGDSAPAPGEKIAGEAAPVRQGEPVGALGARAAMGLARPRPELALSRQLAVAMIKQLPGRRPRPMPGGPESTFLHPGARPDSGISGPGSDPGVATATEAPAAAPPAAPPSIRINIGRLELRSAPPPAPPARRLPPLSLTEYLKNQQGGR